MNIQRVYSSEEMALSITATFATSSAILPYPSRKSANVLAEYKKTTGLEIYC